MRVATAILVFSFFIPTLCEVANAWAAPAHTCTQHQSQQQREDNAKRACCLLATLDRPAVKEQGRSDASALVLDVASEVTLVSAVEFATHPSLLDHQERIDHSPPRLWVLNTAFRI